MNVNLDFLKSHWMLRDKKLFLVKFSSFRKLVPYLRNYVNCLEQFYSFDISFNNKLGGEVDSVSIWGILFIRL